MLAYYYLRGILSCVLGWAASKLALEKAELELEQEPEMAPSPFDSIEMGDLPESENLVSYQERIAIIARDN